MAKNIRGGQVANLATQKCTPYANFILDCEDFDEAAEIHGLRKNKVTCKNQPVCLSCGMILKVFRFKRGAGTKFGDKKSGGVSWAANLTVSDFFKHIEKGAIYNRAKAAGAK
jgi:hypothetical protein